MSQEIHTKLNLAIREMCDIVNQVTCEMGNNLDKKINIIALLQDAQGTDYTDESRKMIQKAINMLESN